MTLGNIYERDRQLEQREQELRKAEAERIARENANQQELAQIAQQRAALDAEKRDAQIANAKARNSDLISATAGANRAMIEQCKPVIEAMKQLRAPKIAAESAWKHQQAMALDTISVASAGGDNTAYRQIEVQLPNAVHLKYALDEHISRITDPDEKRLWMCLAWAVYEIENFEPAPGYSAQDATDKFVKGQRWGGVYR